MDSTKILGLIESEDSFSHGEIKYLQTNPKYIQEKNKNSLSYKLKQAIGIILPNVKKYITSPNPEYKEIGTGMIDSLVEENPDTPIGLFATKNAKKIL